jgi:hypothetical protein
LAGEGPKENSFMPTQDTAQTYYRNFTEWCSAWRGHIENAAQGIKAGMEHEVFKSESDAKRQDGEMKANIMLAFRHLEDAKMRLGKAIQAHDGGKSIYDK